MTVVIFDLNGTLVDSEHAHWMAYSEVLAERGVTFTFEEFSEDWTRTGHDLAFTLEKHNCRQLLAELDDLRRQKEAVFRSTLSWRVSLMAGVVGALERLVSHFDLAIESTSARENIILLLRHFELSEYFRFMAPGDADWDAKRYGSNTKASRLRWIADSLSCLPSDCVMIGDAEKDVKAAIASGMAAIIVPTESTRNHDFGQADLVLASLAELTNGSVRDVLRHRSEVRHPPPP
jgi:beta-phosphoglucomutase-like phosphatase (HAD superfamily)